MDAVFTVTEQEIEDATKFTLERAKQASRTSLLVRSAFSGSYNEAYSVWGSIVRSPYV